MKRLFDIIASGCGLLVLSPIFLIMVIWIKLDSKGPVFYRQVRVGRHNKDFRIFKFRSMAEILVSLEAVISSVSISWMSSRS